MGVESHSAMKCLPKKERLEFLKMEPDGIWQQRGRSGIDIEQILSQGMLPPVTCCQVNPDKRKTVENAVEIAELLFWIPMEIQSGIAVIRATRPADWSMLTRGYKYYFCRFGRYPWISTPS